MKWEKLYENYFDWPEEAVERAVNRLSDCGTASEAVEVIENIYDEDVANRLLEKHIMAGVSFSEEDIDCMCGFVSNEMLGKAILTVGPLINATLLSPLKNIIYEPAGEYVVWQLHKQGYKFSEDELDELMHTVSISTIMKLSEETPYEEEKSPIIKNTVSAQIVSSLSPSKSSPSGIERKSNSATALVVQDTPQAPAHVVAAYLQEVANQQLQADIVSSALQENKQSVDERRRKFSETAAIISKICLILSYICFGLILIPTMILLGGNKKGRR